MNAWGTPDLGTLTDAQIHDRALVLYACVGNVALKARDPQGHREAADELARVVKEADRRGLLP